MANFVKMNVANATTEAGDIVTTIVRTECHNPFSAIRIETFAPNKQFCAEKKIPAAFGISVCGFSWKDHLWTGLISQGDIASDVAEKWIAEDSVVKNVFAFLSDMLGLVFDEVASTPDGLVWNMQKDEHSVF